MNEFIVRNKILTDPADYLNSVKFQIVVPLHVFKIHKEIENNEVQTTTYDNADPYELKISYFTIADILGFFKDRIYFKIYNKLDIYKIYVYVVNYLDSISAITDQLSKEHLKFIKLLIEFKNELDIMLTSISKTDPGIHERYKKYKNSLDSILDEFL